MALRNRKCDTFIARLPARCGASHEANPVRGIPTSSLGTESSRVPSIYLVHCGASSHAAPRRQLRPRRLDFTRYREFEGIRQESPDTLDRAGFLCPLFTLLNRRALFDSEHVQVDIHSVFCLQAVALWKTYKLEIRSRSVSLVLSVQLDVTDPRVSLVLISGAPAMKERLPAPHLLCTLLGLRYTA